MKHKLFYLFLLLCSLGVNQSSGQGWTSDFTSSSTELNSGVLQLKNSGTNLYTEGGFLETTDDRFVKWDGTQWSPIASTLPADASYLNRIAVSPKGVVYLTGTNKEGTQSYLYKLNGSNWITYNLPTIYGNTNSISGSTFDNNDNFYCFASGGDIYSFNETQQQFSSIGSYDTELGFNSLCFNKKDNCLYASGNNIEGLGNIVKWDGTQWTTVGSISGQIENLCVDAQGNLYATVYHVSYWYIIKWNGTEWTIIVDTNYGSDASGANFDKQMACITLDATGNLYFATRSYYPVKSSLYKLGVNDVKASLIGETNTSTTTGYSSLILGLKTDNKDYLFVGGLFTTINGAKHQYLAKYQITKAQTMSFASFGGSRTYGDSNFFASATASSGLPVEYKSSNTSVATISPSTGEVKIVGVGTTTITANQAGNADYHAAPEIYQTLTVYPKTLTVTADNKTVTYGGVTPAYTYTFSGFAYNENASVVSGSGLPTSTYTSTSTGSLPITWSAKNFIASNYSFTYVNGTLTINKANQVITFNSLPSPVTYGDGNFSLSATAPGGAVTFTSSTSAVATVSGNIVTITGAGTCTITAIQAGNDAYTSASSTQTLTIAKKEVTIKVKDKTVPYGTAWDSPLFVENDYEITGLVYNEPTSVINFSPSPVVVYTNTSTGTVPISLTVSNFTAANYTLGNVLNGVITIQKLDQILTFNTIDNKVYGDANFTLSATTNSGLSAITYTSSDEKIAKISGNAVSIVGVGTCTITATEAGNGGYNSATSSQSFTVSQKELTVKATDLTINYGASPMYTYEISGFANNDTETSSVSGKPEVTSTYSTTTTSPVTITCGVEKLTATNYTFKPVNGLITINPNSFLIVTAHSPASSQLSVETTASIVVTFNTSITNATTVVSTFNVDGSISGLIKGNYTVSGNVATFTPTSAYKAGEVITVTLTKSIKNTNNIALLADNTFQFTVKANAASASFELDSTYTNTDTPDLIVTGDVDGDGDLDLIITNSDARTLTILANDGKGSYSEYANPSASIIPTSIATGDVNGDGKLDLVVANNTLGYILISNGNGTYTTSAKKTMAGGSKSLALGDIDNDGDLDLVVASGSASNISIWWNDGNGAFTTNTVLSGISSELNTLTLADTDGNGYLDIIVSNTILRNNGNRNFTTTAINDDITSSYITVADFNGDGNLDLATVQDSTVSILYNNGSGSYANTPNSYTVPNVVSLKSGDFDGDGDIDLIVISGDYVNKRTVSLLRNNNNVFSLESAYTDTSMTYPFISIASGDFDGDGDLDLAAISSDTLTTSILLNKRTKSLRITPETSKNAVTIPLRNESSVTIYSYQKNAFVVNSTTGAAKVTIYDLLGRVIAEQQVSTGLQKIELQNTGLFIVKVVSEIGTTTKKIVISE